MNTIKCLSVETIGGEKIRHGELVDASAFSVANVVRDMHEVITNVVGGKMKRYEAAFDETISRAVDNLKSKAEKTGYDTIIGIKISHPNITDDAIEVVVVGTGFWYALNLIHTAHTDNRSRTKPVASFKFSARFGPCAYLGIIAYEPSQTTQLVNVPVCHRCGYAGNYVASRFGRPNHYELQLLGDDRSLYLARHGLPFPRHVAVVSTSVNKIP